MVVTKGVLGSLFRLLSGADGNFGVECADALLLDRFDDNFLRKSMLCRTLEADEDDVCE